MPKAKPPEGIYNRPRSISDPFEAALRPPPNETDDEREQRLNAEYEAKKISDDIDQMLAHERRMKGNGEIKVLLMGQSESGKSTTLKQFQLMHTRAAFHAERIAWRTVIYLNLVGSVRRILEAISPDVDVDEPGDDDDFLNFDTASAASVIISSDGRPPSAICGTKIPKYETYRERLRPLTELEEHLTRLLSSPDEDEPTRLGPTPDGWNAYGASMEDHYDYTAGNSPVSTNGRPTPTLIIPQLPWGRSGSSPASPQTSSTGSSLSLPYPSPNGTNFSSKSKGEEVAVRTNTNWKRALSLGGRAKSPKSAQSGEIAGWWEDPDDPVHALHALAQAMLSLWQDPSVRRRLAEKQVRIEECSGFYLDEISRITAKKYIPTDEDVLKARLKTIGVVEHSFTTGGGPHRRVSWRIFDVGGARNQRQAWAPYFEDVNAIIFLAPISAFDQVLAEDPQVNRLEDSLMLWKSLVANKLLAEVDIVLFLNKCDLLQAKLEAGVRLKEHLPSYGDRGNDYESASKYFRNRFGALHQSYSPNKARELFIHLTAVTDMRRTAAIISNVRDIILTAYLRDIHLM